MAEPTPRAANYRQSEILAMLRQSGRVGVEELATHFGVTLQTIRRDLNELSDAQGAGARARRRDDRLGRLQSRL